MRIVITMILMLFVITGCANEKDRVQSRARDQIINQYIHDGWQFRGIIVNDLVFAYEVPGGYIVRYISWMSPNSYVERFEPTPPRPW